MNISNIVSALRQIWRAILLVDKKRSLILGSLVAAMLLVGCAGQMAYRDGKQLIAHDHMEAGVEKFKEALKADPGNIEFKRAYASTRERMVTSYVGQADQLLESGNRADAKSLYQKVLVIEPGNHRAHAGIALIEREARHDTLLKEAITAHEGKDLATAKSKLTTVLNENPKNAKALSILSDLEPKADTPALATLLSDVYKKPITIEFKDASLKSVFDVIASTSGLNILFDKDVKADQKTSIFLKNSTVEAAIYYLLLTNQLEQQVMDSNTILIYPNNESKQRDYQQKLVKTFMLSNARAKSVADTIKVITKSRDVVIDEKLNMLIVRDSPDAMRLVEKLVAMQDVAEPEVMLEVEILEVSRSKLLDLGVTWPASLTLAPLATSDGTTTSPLTLTDLRNLNKSTIGATIDPFKINAGGQDSDVNILANPRIRVVNHEKAKIMIGNKVPVITTSISNTIVAESVNYIDVGLKLEVEPSIHLDDDVEIRVGLEVSSIVDTQKSGQGTVTYTIGNRSANTILRLKNGENQVLAGLIRDEDTRSVTKVPGMGDLPIVGRLFGSTSNNDNKTEVLLSITPHLIRNIQRLDASASEFLSGTENSLRRRPDLSPRLSAGLAVASSTSIAANGGTPLTATVAPSAAEAVVETVPTSKIEGTENAGKAEAPAVQEPKAGGDEQQ